MIKLFSSRFLLLFLILIKSPLSLWSQQEYATLKTATSKAIKLFEKAQDQARAQKFDDAFKTLEKLEETAPLLVDGYLLQAAIHYDTKNFTQAEGKFNKALTLAPEYKPRAWYQSGLSKLKQDKYEAAIPDFTRYLELEKKERVKLRARAEKHLANCQFAAEAVKSPVPFEPKSIGEAINTPGFEYLPSIMADGSYLVYTTRIRNQEDLYFSENKEGVWQEGKALAAINTPGNEATQTLSADGRLLVYTACNRKDGYGGCDLYFSELRSDNWTRPINIGSPINTKTWDSQPSLSASGNTLYFASERGGGKGNKDLWLSYRNKNGTWTKPENLGDQINTKGNEQSPFMHPDGKTLYFMSDGHPGMGDYDLFYSRKDDQGNWTKPQNLGYPINTKAHEGALFVSLDGTTAYFASDKDFTASGDKVNQYKTTDIYYFELYSEARPEPVTYVKAVVRDLETKAFIQANTTIVDLSSGEILYSKPTGENGSFLITLPTGKNYALNVSKEKYLFHSENFQLENSNEPGEPYLLEIDLIPIPENPAEELKEGKAVVLKNVFFETGSAALLSASQAELGRLFKLLADNLNLKIQINGHTDNVGSEEDNLALSENRAKAVHDYLIEKGIAAERLKYQGFGEEHPIDNNETEEGRRNNRRTEFVLIQ